MKKFVVVEYAPFSPYLEYREHEDDIRYFATAGPYNEIKVNNQLTVYDRMGDVVGVRLNIPNAINTIKDDAYKCGVNDVLDVINTIISNITNVESKRIVEEVIKRTIEIVR